MSIELINRVCELASEVGKASMIIDQKDKYIEQLEAAHKTNEERIADQANIITEGRAANEKLQQELRQRAIDG